MSPLAKYILYSMVLIEGYRVSQLIIMLKTRAQ